MAYDLSCQESLRPCLWRIEMSFTAAHESKHTRHACQSCRNRKARFKYRGSVRADRDHTLCFECYRSERERQRARLLGEAQVAHRRAMLAPVEHTAAARGGLRQSSPSHASL